MSEDKGGKLTKILPNKIPVDSIDGPYKPPRYVLRIIQNNKQTKNAQRTTSYNKNLQNFSKLVILNATLHGGF